MDQGVNGINAYEIDPSKNANANKTEIDINLFSNIDFGPLKQYLDDDNITDMSYSNKGQLWLKSLDKGVFRVDNPGINDTLMEKIAFQCANIMGKTFNMASPFLDSESSELRMNFVHDSIARNGIAAVFRKTPAKIRLKKEKIIEDKYVTENIHDFLIDCVKGHCNIIVAGETGSGKTELVKYLASHTAENEKLITIEDTLELHLDRIFPQRDIVAMKTNNVASYTDVLVTCMRQNPKWILLSEVRSAEAVTAVRNSISSGHNILSTIHADKAHNIPHRLYSLLESNIDVEQFMTTIYRYIQLGVYVRARYENGHFMREVCEVCEFYVTEDNKPEYNIIYQKNIDGTAITHEPSKYLKSYLEINGVTLDPGRITNSDAPFANDANTSPEDKKPSNTDNKNIDPVLKETSAVKLNSETTKPVENSNNVTNTNNVTMPNNTVNNAPNPANNAQNGVQNNISSPSTVNTASPTNPSPAVQVQQSGPVGTSSNPYMDIIKASTEAPKQPSNTLGIGGVSIDKTQYLDPVNGTETI